MSDPRSKRYTLEQHTYMVENIFEPVRTKLHSVTSKRSLRRCQTLKRSELLKDSKLLTRSKMNRDLLEDEPRSGRPHTLSDDDRTELREYMEEHPVTSTRRAAQQLGHKRETGRKTLKEEGFFHTEYQCCTNENLKITLRVRIIVTGSSTNLAVMSKQCQRFFFR